MYSIKYVCALCKWGKDLFMFSENVMPGVYSKGDFMVHLAGLNDKKTWIKKILRDIQEEEKMSEKRKQAKNVDSHRH